MSASVISINDPAIVAVLDAWKVNTESGSTGNGNDPTSSSLWTSILIQMNEVIVTAMQHKENAAGTRKGLADSTKALKKNLKTCETNFSGSPDIEALASQCKSTVKSYQEQIDILTRRCKAYEQSYHTLATTMSTELPDPSIALSVLVTNNQQYQMQVQLLSDQTQQLSTQNSKLEQENKKLTTELQANAKKLKSQKSFALSKDEYDELLKLRTEVAEYDAEIRNLKNQDVTVRKLEAKIEELQTAGAAAIDAAIAAAKVELAETEGRKVTEAYEREAVALQKIQSLELQLQSERAGRVASQNSMLETDEGLKLLEATWDAQRQILIDDNYRIREELQLITKQRDGYYSQITRYERASASGGNIAMRVDSDYDTSPGSGVVSIPLDGTSSLLVSSPPASAGVGGLYASKHDLVLERQAYEAEVAELSETNRLLRDELRTKDDVVAVVKQQYQIKLDTVESEYEALQDKISVLQQQLESAPTQAFVDSMKRELRILRRLEYNAHPDGQEDPEMTGIHYNTAPGTVGNVPSASLAVGATESDASNDDLESLLVAKLRRVESDLVTERTMKNELQQQILVLQHQIETMQEDKDAVDKLVLSLEKDLECAIAAQSTTTNSATGTAPYGTTKKKIASTSTGVIAPLTVGNPQTLESILDPSSASLADTADLVPVAKPDDRKTPVMSSSTSTSGTEQHTVATIIMAQRDRLKQRCDALEAERDSFKRELQIQVQTTESLKSDNTKLYEKVRYLQNFGNITKNASAARTIGNSTYQRSYSISDGGRDLDLEALEQRYEASVDPFKQFSKSERQRKLNEMSSVERTVFIVAKTVLATKEMRTGLFIYVVTLHFLVFVTTYHWSHSTDDCNSHYLNMEHLAHLPPSLQGPFTTSSTALTNSSA